MVQNWCADKRDRPGQGFEAAIRILDSLGMPSPSPIGGSQRGPDWEAIRKPCPRPRGCPWSKKWTGRRSVGAISTESSGRNVCSLFSQAVPRTNEHTRNRREYLACNDVDGVQRREQPQTEAEDAGCSVNGASSDAAEPALRAGSCAKSSISMYTHTPPPWCSRRDGPRHLRARRTTVRGSAGGATHLATVVAMAMAAAAAVAAAAATCDCRRSPGTAGCH